MNIALVVEYEGTRYHGSQVQPTVPTIQGELERALTMVTGQKIRTSYAGRTDQGVHAKGQVVAFHTDSPHSPYTIARALNYYLPDDIAIRDSYMVNDDFDPRRDALRREYCYYIWNSRSPSPLLRRYAFFIPSPLDIAAMNEACQAILGTHDFAPFASCLNGNRNTIRTVYQAMLTSEGDLVRFYIVANSFLSHQIRNTMGALVKVGLGKSDVANFYDILKSKKPATAGPTLPPHGLCLLKVYFPGEIN
jgi:tRNA pseudouridine38-40 synthase